MQRIGMVQRAFPVTNPAISLHVNPVTSNGQKTSANQIRDAKIHGRPLNREDTAKQALRRRVMRAGLKQQKLKI